MADQEALVALAKRYSVPPPLVFAIHAVRQEKSEREIEDYLRVVRDAFDQFRSWEQALSHAETGDRNVHESPTHPAAGTVNAILGIAAARPEWGMSGWRPLDMDAYAPAVKAMERTAKRLAQLGGVVTPDHVERWAQGITRLRQPVAQPREVPAPTPVHPPRPPVPLDTHRAEQVGEFAARLRSLGITPEQFKELFPHVARVRRMLLGPHKVEVDHIVPHIGQSPEEILQTIRSMPHERYPAYTVGQVYDAFHTASLYSVQHLRRMPYVSEVTRMISAGHGAREMESFYRGIAEARRPYEKKVDEEDKEKTVKLKVVS